MVKPARGHRVGDVARGDRAVELAALAGLADDDDGDAVELLRHLLRLAAALEILGLELGALLLEIGEVLLGRAQRLLLRQQIVAGKARPHLHDLAHLAQFLHPLEQDDFDRHGASPSAGCRARARGSARA